MSNTAPIALVTGSSRGLGRSMAVQLAARGVDVIVTFHSNEAAAAEVVAAVSAHGRKAVALPLDASKVDTFDAFADTLRRALSRTWGRETFDLLVHNAGTGGGGPISETTEAQFDALVDVHFKGPFFLTQRLLPLLADGGRILNVSSGLSRYAFPGQAVYAAVKGAIDVLTRYQALELGARGITVNAVAPGGVETDFGGGVMRDPGLQKYVAEQTALGRVAQPDDIGGLVALLLAPEARWLTGQRIEVTGGFRL